MYLLYSCNENTKPVIFNITINLHLCDRAEEEKNGWSVF